MLPYDGGLAAAEGSSISHARDPGCEQQEQEQLQDQKNDSASHGSDGASDHGRRPEVRRRRGLVSSPPQSAEAAASAPLKRRRTPSRRVVEAAESAVLLEEVIANDAFFSRTQGQAQAPRRGPQPYDNLYTGEPCHLQWGDAGSSDPGDVCSRVAALREALWQQQRHQGFLASDYNIDGGHLHSLYGATGTDCSSLKGIRQRWDSHTPLLKGRRRFRDAPTPSIPTCRRSLFGAVEPKDLLGFGVPLGDVLRTKCTESQQHQQSGAKPEQNQPLDAGQKGPQQHQRKKPAFVVDVAVIGAGVAGLAAAAYLRRCGATVVVFEGRRRVGGRTFSSVMPKRELPDGRKVEQVVVDLGASYMHCVTAQPKGESSGADCRWRREPSRSVSGIAAVLQPLVADVAGKQNWESTLFASWYDEASGRELPFTSVLKVHELLDRLRERTAAKLLHLPPPLTSSGGPGPSSASLPNTVPAAEFLSPSLDQLLRAALARKSRAKTSDSSNDIVTPVSSNSSNPFAGGPSISSINIEEEEGSLSSRRAPKSQEDGGRSGLALRTEANDTDAGEEVSAALLEHDTSDPCCCWATTAARERGPEHQRKGISACRFDRYYPLGSTFIRKAIKAFGGCPLCCTGSCGGAQRLHDGKQQAGFGGGGEDESDCSKRVGLWGPPAPLVPAGNNEKAAEVFPLGSPLGAGNASTLEGSPTGETSSDTGDAKSTSKARRQLTPFIGNSKGGDKDPADGLTALHPSPRKECTKQHARRCSSTHSVRGGSANGQPILKGNRSKKSSAAAGAHAQVRLVPPLSLHNNRGFRRSAWDALEASLCELLAEAEAEGGGPSVSGTNKDASRDYRPHRSRKVSLSPSEARMLLVVLQSRLGYVGDLRELPLSAVKNYPYEIAGVPAPLKQRLLNCCVGALPVPLAVPPPSSMQRLRMQQAALEMALQQEQRVQIYPFSASAASSADKIVVDGWGWLPLFLSLQVFPFVVTEATVHSIHIRPQSEPVTPSVAATASSPPVEAVEGKQRSAGAGSPPEERRGDSSSDDDEGDWGHLAKSHPVCLRVEANRRLQYRASHGLPQAAMEQEHPTHVWARAKYCVVAVPLAQLALAPLPPSRVTPAGPSADPPHPKAAFPPTLGLIDFSPPLGEDRRRALSRYRMGCHNKVVIRWHPDDIFWDPKSLQLNCLDQKFQFLNLHAYGKTGCLLAHCFPPFSSGYGGLQTDDEVVAEVVGLLQEMFGISDAAFPRPVDFIVSRWEEDCFSRGSYSTPGVNAYDNDLDVMRAPHPLQDPRVLFCGEYLSKAYFQCVDGAFDTGLRAGEAVAHECLQLPLPPREDSKRFALDFFCLPPRSADQGREVSALSSANRSTQRQQEHETPPPSSRDGEGKCLTGAGEREPQRPQGLLPQCPFSGFPLPPLPRALRGHYLTDQSDLGLTDAEGDDWGEGGGGKRGAQNLEFERRRPEVAAAEEYFLARCLSFIKTRSARLLEALGALQQQDSCGDLSKSESPLDDYSECEEPRPCQEKAATKIAVTGDGECQAEADSPPALPSLPHLSEAALSFQRRLPRAAQRLFYRTFLSEFPLTSSFGASTDAEQQEQNGSETPKHELKSNAQEQHDCEEQERLPLLTDLLDAIFMCASSVSNSSNSTGSQGSGPSEAALLLSLTFTRRIRRGGGGKALDMGAFLLLLARNNKIIRESVLRPIRSLAQTFPQDSDHVQESLPKAESHGVSSVASDATSLKAFVNELMLPALPAHARNAKPPRMAAVAAGVLLMEALEKLCAAAPPAASDESQHHRPFALDSLVLKSLASSQFVSDFSRGTAAQGTAARQREEEDVPEPLQHEQLCWLCRGEGDLLLCDGLPPPVSYASATSEGDAAVSNTEAGRAAHRPCRHVFHIGCSFPPPTPAELQPNAHWSCPLCKAKAFRELHGLQQRQQSQGDQQKQNQQQQQPGQDSEQHQQGDDDREQLSQQDSTQRHEDKNEGVRPAGGVIDAEDPRGHLLHQVFASVDSLAQLEVEERTARQSQLQLASCEELQMAALKRLFVDKARGLLARTRQLCKRLDALSSKRKRLWAAARRRKWRLRFRLDRREPQSPPSAEAVVLPELTSHLSHKQQHPEHSKPDSRSASPSRDKDDFSKTEIANNGEFAADALRLRCSFASAAGAQASEREGRSLQTAAEDEHPTRRTRSRSTLVTKPERHATGAGAAAAMGKDPVNTETAAAATRLGTPSLPGGERAEEGEGETSDASQDEDSSDGDSEHPLDQFAAAAQAPSFAAALRVFSQVRQLDAASLPVTISALQHHQHTTRGCCCNRQRQPFGTGGQTKTAAQDMPCATSTFSSNSNTDAFCSCGAQGSLSTSECLCVHSARKDAAAALRGLLVFRDSKQVSSVPERSPVRCLVPYIRCSDAEIEALSQGDPSWLNRLVRPSRKRRPLQPRRISRDLSEGEGLHVRQQALVIAARLQQLQQQRQLQLEQQQRSVQPFRPVNEALVTTSVGSTLQSLSPVLQPHASVQAQQGRPGFFGNLQHQQPATDNQMRCLRQLLHTVQQQQQQQQQHSGGLPVQPAKLIELHQQLLLQQQRSAAAPQAVQGGRLASSAAAGAPFSVPSAAEVNARTAQLLAQLRLAQSFPTPQQPVNPMLEGQLEQQRRLQERLRQLQQHDQQAPLTQQPASTGAQQQWQQQEQLAELLQKAQHDAQEEQRLRQRVLRLQQLQRQLLLLQLQQRQGEAPHQSRPQL